MLVVRLPTHYFVSVFHKLSRPALGNRRFLPRGVKQAWSLEQTFHLHLIPRSRVRGATLPFCHMPLHCDVLIKPSELMTFLLSLHLKTKDWCTSYTVCVISRIL